MSAARGAERPAPSLYKVRPVRAAAVAVLPRHVARLSRRSQTMVSGAGARRGRGSPEPLRGLGRDGMGGGTAPPGPGGQWVSLPRAVSRPAPCRSRRLVPKWWRPRREHGGLRDPQPRPALGLQLLRRHRQSPGLPWPRSAGERPGSRTCERGQLRAGCATRGAAGRARALALRAAEGPLLRPCPGAGRAGRGWESRGWAGGESS